MTPQELLQEDVATFDGHIVEALMKTPEIKAMYPERKLFAIGWVKHKCKAGYQMARNSGRDAHLEKTSRR
ncbi:hypothetical protein BU58_29415 [Escherichia coli O26:H11 str. 2011C-3274]|nr:hypothetical protein BU58_29415 [Escherichia coli O26:H11 str. 2011C-3274]